MRNFLLMLAATVFTFALPLASADQVADVVYNGSDASVCINGICVGGLDICPVSGVCASPDNLPCKVRGCGTKIEIEVGTTP